MTDTLPGARTGVLAPVSAPVRDAREAALLDGLRALAARLGRDTLRAADIEADAQARAARVTMHALRWRFGSFARALAAAGLRPPSSNHFSDDECFANLGRVWRHHGRAPVISDMNRSPSTVGSAAYIKRAGSWRTALDAYAAFTGAASSGTGPAGRVAVKPEPAAHAPRRHSGASTPLSLRFHVLQRDRFRCTACGNSPARDPDCRLQVDHILPRSQGGRSTPENLRCLCAACNLGRGDRA
ncbi:MAG: HNH endonuclease [Rhodospirillales bacterium]|nr:HNH endonuclease [Rhodospirillales bacterium]